MTFNIGIGSTLIASSTDDGIPYLWKSGDITSQANNQTTITASDGAANDEFGVSVAVGCGRIVVGAPIENERYGAAYIYDLDGNQLGIVTASDGGAHYNSTTQSDRFGDAVAVGYGRIVVGAWYYKARGAAFIYDLDGNSIATVGIPTTLATDDRLGNSVGVGCSVIVVGSDGNDDNGQNSGSIYIYDLDGNNEIKVNPSDGAANELFGESVAVGNGRIVAGAYVEFSGGIYRGAAYIFDLKGNEIKKLTASDGGNVDSFGRSVAVGCGRIVVGAYQWDGDFTDQGAAYIFNLNGDELRIITDPSPGFNANFGYTVAVGSGRIVVGARTGMCVYDLDGNFIQKISVGNAPNYNVSFGHCERAVSVGSGKIVIGQHVANTNKGLAYSYDTPNVYTLYDAIDLQSY